MSIQVTCPNCLKRFQVSDKFGGKTGPCPACKKPIKVPEKSEEVVIHAPEDESPKDSSGQSVLKPITREDPELTSRTLLVAGVAIIGVFAVAVGFRLMAGEDGIPLWAQILGLIALAPPIVQVGYSFVYDRELAPYVGPELRQRVLICSALFAALWLVYAFIPSYLFDLDRPSEMSWTFAGIIFCAMLVLGAFASVGTFELEFANGFVHSAMYVVAIIVLALVAGVQLAGAAGVGG